MKKLCCVNMLSPDPSLPVLQVCLVCSCDSSPNTAGLTLWPSLLKAPPPLLCTAAVMPELWDFTGPRKWDLAMLKADRVGMAMIQTSDLSQEEWSGAGCWSGGPFGSQNFLWVFNTTYGAAYILRSLIAAKSHWQQQLARQSEDGLVEWGDEDIGGKDCQFWNRMLWTFISNWGSQDAAFKSHLLNKIILKATMTVCLIVLFGIV